MTIEESNKLSGASAVMDHRPFPKSTRPKRLFFKQDGFTLIEVMIAIGIVSIVLGGIYGAFQGQIRTFNTQEQVVEMQQNIRVARYFLERELRLAGLDPTGNAGAGITVANADTITFSMDVTGGQGDGLDNDGDDVVDEGSDGNDDDGDGLIDEPDEAEWFNGSTADANEQVTYALSNDNDTNGINDGLPTDFLKDDSPCHLLRNGQVVAANIDAIRFVYLGVNPADNSCDNDCVLATPVADDILDDIRSVQIALIARSGDTVRTMTRAYTNTTRYYSQPPTSLVILSPQNDAFRRVRLITNVQCRNLGL